MALKGYRAPLLAGLVLFAGLGWWASLERAALDQRHRAETRRFVDGALLALDASHDLLRPLSSRPGRRPQPTARQGRARQAPASPPADRDLVRLQPVLRRMIEAQPRIRWVAVVCNGAVVAGAGPVSSPLAIDGPRGERAEDGLHIAWRPLGAPLRPRHLPGGPPPGSGGPLTDRDGPLLPHRPGNSDRAGRAWDVEGRRPPLPPGAPIAVIAMEAGMPAEAARRGLLQIGQKIGTAALGVVALLLAWVRGIRSRTLRHQLEAERVQRSHLEELSLAASGLAHETKNPLGIIRGLAQRLERSEGLPTQNREAAGQILEEADRAVARLGEFMSYARIRQPEIGTVDGRRILDRAVAVLATDLESAGVTATIEAGQTAILADHEMLLQILLNLMLNSLEASSPGGVVNLRLVARAGVASLVVEDQGQGIGPELLDRIFKPYVTGRADGHGLGLAIVKRLVDHHGWLIDVHSRPGRGTTVEIGGIRTVDRRSDSP